MKDREIRKKTQNVTEIKARSVRCIRDELVTGELELYPIFEGCELQGTASAPQKLRHCNLEPCGELVVFGP